MCVCVHRVLLCATLFKFAKNIGIPVNILFVYVEFALHYEYEFEPCLSFPNHFFCSEHFQKMVLYFAAFGSFNVKLQTELICILHWKWFLEKANVIHHQQQRCDAMRRKMENSVWVWTESSVRSWYDLIIIWDYDADDDNDNDINDDDQRRKKCTFPIVRQFGRRCPFLFGFLSLAVHRNTNRE